MTTRTSSTLAIGQSTDSVESDLLSLDQASQWATDKLNRPISSTNISYLVQYGKVKKYGHNGHTQIHKHDLELYYANYHGSREETWKKSLGNDLNWALSFDTFTETQTTKHVHRLHPYKGKFIPQLVEYFLDEHIDQYKKQVFFHPGDCVLDPFCGSGTTLVQANELGLHSIGVDVSAFNCLISEVKLATYDLIQASHLIQIINATITQFESDAHLAAFDQELTQLLSQFNTHYFPSPQFKYDVNKGLIAEATYAQQHERTFANIYSKLVEKYQVHLIQSKQTTFLDQWYVASVRSEIDFALSQIKKIRQPQLKKLLAVILSRTIRSCRATTHSDLATLITPQYTPYYCVKHKKICKPLISIKYWFNRYAQDTLQRLRQFQQLRSDAQTVVISADSRRVDVIQAVQKKNLVLAERIQTDGIQGIFTSPPYVGQIDYHEQHAYAYELFGYPRQDELEIGPLYKGKGAAAKTSYIEGISQVLSNCNRFLTPTAHIFLVANDKHNLYPTIANRSGIKIVNQFKRPVLNRTERDKNPYSETIFYCQKV